jgi:UDP-glucose 4-epimerase
MKVLVTGATGNVGTALVRALVDEPAITEVVGLARRAPDPAGDGLPDAVRMVTADIAKDDLDAHLAGMDAVVHLAWLIQPSHSEDELRAVNVEGTRRVFEAAGRAGVGTLVHASSVGAYAPGPKDRPTPESHPTTGVPTSVYSRHKAAAERLLDRFERDHADVRVVRVRPGVVLQRAAATEIRRLFAGPLLPRFLVRPELLPVLPLPSGLGIQAVHATDLADAYRRILVDPDARGAYNVATEPPLRPATLAQALGAKHVPVPAKVLRALVVGTWQARLHPVDAGWLDMAMEVPLMDTSRIRGLGWAPQVEATDALLELLDGMRRGDDRQTPPLDRDTSGPARAKEFATGIGGTSGAT